MNVKISIVIGIAIVIAIGVIFGLSMTGNDLQPEADSDSENIQPDEGKEYVLEFSDIVNPSTGP